MAADSSSSKGNSLLVEWEGTAFLPAMEAIARAGLSRPVISWNSAEELQSLLDYDFFVAQVGLQCFSRNIGEPNAHRFNQFNSCTILTLRKEYSLHLTFEPISKFLFLYAPAMDGIPPSLVSNPLFRLKFYDTLMTRNFLGTKAMGGCSGIAIKEGLCLIHTRLHLAHRPPRFLGDSINSFIKCVEELREAIKALEHSFIGDALEAKSVFPPPHENEDKTKEEEEAFSQQPYPKRARLKKDKDKKEKEEEVRYKGKLNRAKLMLKLMLTLIPAKIGKFVLRAAKLGKVSEEAQSVLRKVLKRFKANAKSQLEAPKEEEDKQEDPQEPEEGKEEEEEEEKYKKVLELLNVAVISELEEALHQQKQEQTGIGTDSNRLFGPFREAVLALDWLFKPPGQPSSLQCASDNLLWFGTNLGLNNLTFNESMGCVLRVDDKFSLHLNYKRDAKMLYLYSPLFVGLIEDEPKRLQFCETLLAASTLGGQFVGGGVGWDGKGLVLMHLCLNMRRAPKDTLTRYAAIFVDAVERWRETLHQLVESNEEIDVPTLLNAFAPRTTSNNTDNTDAPSFSASGLVQFSSTQLHNLFTKQ